MYLSCYFNTLISFINLLKCFKHYYYYKFKLILKKDSLFGSSATEVKLNCLSFDKQYLYCLLNENKSLFVSSKQGFDEYKFIKKFNKH